MTRIDSDRDLRELFSRMKGEDRIGAPAFRAPPVSPTDRPSWLRATMTGLAAAAIVIATLKAADYRRAAAERDRGRAEIRRALYTGTAWTSPTDFLLNTSTSHLLRVVPTFGPAHWINTDSTSLHTRYRS